MRLVADIGGTNARLAICEHGEIVPQSVRDFKNDDWSHFHEMLTAYLADQSQPRLMDLVIAVAGPVRGTQAILTNRNWTISASELQQSARCDSAILLNDLTALGYAAPELRSDQTRKIHSGDAQVTGNEQSLVVGVGTGFNVSPVIKSESAVQCLAVEAGHVSMPSSVLAMIDQIGGDESYFPTVEELFSGRGFTAFCRNFCGDKSLEGVNVIASYGSADAVGASIAVDHYATLLGILLHDLSLAYMPNTGVYLAGSVARAIIDVAPSYCVNSFRQPCTIRSGSRPNLYAITDDRAALRGCAAYRR